MSSSITLSAGVRQNLLSLQSTADLMATTQNRLATGKKVNSALDNPSSFFTSQSLQNRAGDLNDLLDNIGQAQKTLEAANQGISSLTKLVQSAQSIAKQAQQAAGPSTSYSAIGQGGTAQTESLGTFTGSGFGVTTVGTVNFSVTVNGTAYNLSFATGAADAVATVAANMQAAIDANSNTVGHVAVSVSGGQVKIDNQDVNTDVKIIANAESVLVGLTTGAASPANDRAINSTNLVDNIVAAGGTAGTSTLTVAVNGGTNQVLTFGYGVNQVHDLAGLNTALAGLTGTTASATGTGNRTIAFSVAATTNSANSLVLTGSTGVDTGLGITSGTYNGVATTTNNSIRASLQSDYNNILTQINALAGDSSYNGVNLIYGDNLKITFNEKNTSSLTITGVTLNSSGLGLQAIGGSQFQSNASIDTVLTNLGNALTTLRTQASKFGANVTVVQTRQDFTKNLITTLQTGADGLVLADTNEEGANMLALQTRQQLSTTALSLANQASQAVLRLFG
jgi:flagellin-like hook-associated protein FlgL